MNKELKVNLDVHHLRQQDNNTQPLPVRYLLQAAGLKDARNWQCEYAELSWTKFYLNYSNRLFFLKIWVWAAALHISNFTSNPEANRITQPSGTQPWDLHLQGPQRILHTNLSTKSTTGHRLQARPKAMLQPSPSTLCGAHPRGRTKTLLTHFQYLATHSQTL